MPGGYMGKMLFVDLTKSTITEKKLTEDLAVNFIGGYGLGAKILYDIMKPGAKPLGPDNVLGFVTGPATGSGAFFGSRYMVVCKSPVTNGWNDSNSGGYFGPELKKAGFDAIFFTGAADRPVYLWIKNGQPELRDAGHLWGKDSKETLTALIEETGESKLKAAVIGPAGEKKALMAGIINEGHRAAARGGGGAVMGSKMLKAVAVIGDGVVQVANPDRIKKINRQVIDSMKNGPLREPLAGFGQQGTGSTTPGSALDGNTPVKNWAGVGLVDFGEEAASRIGSAALDKYKSKKYACAHCPLGCGAKYDVREGPWPLGPTERPEYETAAAFGTLLLNSNGESILKCNELCNRAGLDTISTGGTVAWAMECYNRGLLTRDDLDGIELKWGDSKAIVALTEKIARGEGCGAVLANGSQFAANHWGRGIDCLQTVMGIELPLHDPKYAPGFVRSYQYDPTPGRHVKGGLGHSQEVGDLKDKYNYFGTGFLDLLDTVNNEVLSSAGFCLFMDFPSPEGVRNNYIEAITGWMFNMQQCYIAGKRILNMRHAFNLREGFKLSDFVVPERVVGIPPQDEGPLSGITVDNELLGRNFFQAVNWDPSTGKPTLESLRALGGLENVIDDLYGEES